MSSSPERAVLQKLLWPRQTMQYVDEGAQLLGGPVVLARDVAGVRVRAEVLQNGFTKAHHDVVAEWVPVG